MQANYCRNMDYSGFATLVEATYKGFRKVDAQLDRALPFPIFQHTCVSALNAKLISYAKVENRDNRFNMDEDPTAYSEHTKLPTPIMAYLSRIGGTTTQGGENVRLNIPDAVIPQGPIAAQAIGAGSFGIVAEESHNKYEVAMAPIVSAGLITATVDRAAGAPRTWNPLPEGAFPLGGVANTNLLGYREIQDYNPDGRGRLTQVVGSFVQTDSTQGRILLNDECNRAVTTYLTRQDRIKSSFGIPTTTSMPLDLTFVESSGVQGTASIAAVKPTIWTSCMFGATQSSKERLFCMRRRRTEQAPGVCYTVQGVAPANWVQSRNANFLMKGDFGPVAGNGGVLDELNTTRYTEAAHLGSRIPLLAQWVERVQL